jgi:hypothetical protein
VGFSARCRCEPCAPCALVEKESQLADVCLIPAIASKIIPEGEILLEMVMLSAQTGVSHDIEPNHRVAIN